jgi:two-component system, OmpR family, phosphate regulon response regulator PhoB
VATKILIVEDEPAIRELVSVNLRFSGYEVQQAAQCNVARQLIDNQLPDLILLDWMLPDSPGIELAKRLRSEARTRDIPIIMLTARAEESDKLSGFEAGVDDYLTKPFSPRELLARIRAQLRRRTPELLEQALESGGIKLDPVSYRVSAQGQSIDLSPTEFKLLHFFMKNPDRVLSRTKLLDAVWGDQSYIEERTVDVHIRRLRLALQPGGAEKQIETVRGGGYRFLPVA